MSKFIDLAGKQFGKLIVLYRDESLVNSDGKHRTI